MRRMLSLAGVTALLAGCAVLRAGHSGPKPEDELQRALAVLDSQKFVDARNILVPLIQAHPMETEGRRAMLVLMAAELDPRNPDRQLWYGSEVAGTLLNNTTVPAWQVPIAQSFYLIAQELGAHEDELQRAEQAAADAEREAAAAKRLPQYQGESYPARLKKVQADRDALDHKVDQLQAALAAKDKELTATKAELARIKKTIKQ